MNNVKWSYRYKCVRALLKRCNKSNNRRLRWSVCSPNTSTKFTKIISKTRGNEIQEPCSRTITEVDLQDYNLDEPRFP